MSWAVRESAPCVVCAREDGGVQVLPCTGHELADEGEWT